MRERVDVAIAGAGIAGLKVARELSAAGLRVSLLEARERVGGRLLSHRRDGVGLDLGATWFWPNEPRVLRLIEELHVATHPQHLTGDAVFHAGAHAERVSGNPMDVPSGRFVAGAQALAEALAQRLPDGVLHLGQAVTHVRASSEHIEIQTTSGALSAAHLVVALPPALALARIRFEPGLPRALAELIARTPVWMGAITKVVAVYPGPFWRSAGLAGAGISHVGPMREVHDMSGPQGHPAALFGFAPTARAGAGVERSEVLGQLSTMFGPAAGEPVELLIFDWSKEAYTSPPGVAGLSDYTAFGDPGFVRPALGGRLHWASTETASESPGHIEGALAGAARAVAAVRDALLKRA